MTREWWRCRYLILTYAAEFDRVHYPLPLAHVEEPPAHALLSTIKRLRGEIWGLKNGHGQLSSHAATLRPPSMHHYIITISSSSSTLSSSEPSLPQTL